MHTTFTPARSTPSVRVQTQANPTRTDLNANGDHGRQRLSRRKLMTIGATAGLGAAGLALVGCGDDDEPDVAATEAAAPAELTTISLALDWVPNTNHTGFYVADAMGWYEESGVKFEILPYSGAPPDTLVGTGTADFGISFAPSLSFAVASGLPLVSVMAILQRPASAIAVRADRDDIQSPADLDGKLFAGFGAPFEDPLLKTVIQNAGGEGKFETVVLDTAAYEALYSGAVDFVIPFMTWEGIEAELRGTPMKAFEYADYGFPNFYEVVLISNPDWLGANADTARAFVGASQRGFEYAAEKPNDAVQILIDANPGVFSNEELAFRSAHLLASEQYLDENGDFGVQTLDLWTAFPRFLFENGLLVDENGDGLTDELDYSALFTNDFLT